MPDAALDDNTVDGTPDLKIVYPDRAFAHVEVTTAVDEDETAAVKSDGFAGWAAPTLAISWMLGTFGPAPNFKKLRKNAAVEKQLLLLEGAGFESFTSNERMTYQVRAAFTQAEPELGIWRAMNTLACLGVEHGRVGPAPQHASGPHLSFSLARGGVRGPSAEPVAPWTTDFVSDSKRNDNIRKLDRGGAETHLAVQVHLSGPGIAVWDGVGDSDRIGFVPSEDPELPTTITDLWLAVSFREGDVLHWGRGRGWKALPTPRWSVTERVVVRSHEAPAAYHVAAGRLPAEPIPAVAPRPPVRSP
ncbi:hypothetical protein Acsp06_65300 [Actinomycetospora sp. NBRC 106375]|uniref:hypothetical protein n=1 Tax=Actinomycetospora sp. NBRC 106375 TaxID=3032207 RepID=UPI0024A37AF3|nr:hypothetical protein [Actinomycetospora sp. NBRC 106375]GLZ50345.1 hypothetical protein Acsp06_65300 [Actinomycetospora sp. NBRC 106375]